MRQRKVIAAANVFLSIKILHVPAILEIIFCCLTINLSYPTTISTGFLHVNEKAPGIAV